MVYSLFKSGLGTWCVGAGHGDDDGVMAHGDSIGGQRCRSVSTVIGYHSGHDLSVHITCTWSDITQTRRHDPTACTHGDAMPGF